VIEIEFSPEAMKDQRTSRFYTEASLDEKKLQTAQRADRLLQSEAERRLSGRRRGCFLPPAIPRPGNSPPRANLSASCFPNRFYFVDETRGVSAGFHLIEGFFRDDQPLCHSVLSAEEKRHLDRLWDELYFSTKIHDKMLHGFVFFEREERGFLKHPDFNSIREEDPDLVKEENLLRFEQDLSQALERHRHRSGAGKAPDSCVF